jgi:hypothetical protein
MWLTCLGPVGNSVGCQWWYSEQKYLSQVVLNNTDSTICAMAHAAALTLAESLGLANTRTWLPSASSQLDTPSVFGTCATAHGSAMQLASSVQALSDGAQVSQLTDCQRLRQRATQLQRATAALDAVVQTSGTLAVRFQDSTTLQTVPVEPDIQADFSLLLQTVAKDTAWMAKDALQDLHWAGSFHDPPRAWQQHLASLSSVRGVCKAYEQLLVHHGAAIHQLKDSATTH